MKKGNLQRVSIVVTLVLGISSVAVFIGCQSGENKITGTLYVGGHDTGKIYVIDPDLEELVTTIDLPAGAEPDWLTLSPDHKKLYCSSASQNIVYIVDTVTDTYEKEVAVCPTPHGIAFTPDGSKAVVGCYYDLSIIDVATGTYVNNDPDATISGFLAQISGIGVHPTNNRLYAAIGSGFVAHALVAGSATVSTYSPLSASGALMDVAISKDGNTLYVTEAYQGTLEIADINAGDGSLAHNSEAANPSAYYGRLILAPNGEKLYISRYCASQIDYMNTSGTPAMSTFDIQYNSNTYGQRDIALSDDGSVAFVLVGHSFFHTIVVLDTTNGSILGTITLPPSEANSIVYKP